VHALVANLCEKEPDVSQKAKIELKATVNTTSLQDALEFDVDSAVAAVDERFMPNDYRDFELFGGSSEGIEFVFIKLAPEDPKPANPQPPVTTPPAPRSLKLAFALDNQDPQDDLWLDLQRSVLLLGRAAYDLMPQKLERVLVRNNFSVPVNVSVLVGRKKVPRPLKPLQKDGN
jgi:hypothetical protein